MKSRLFAKRCTILSYCAVRILAKGADWHTDTFWWIATNFSCAGGKGIGIISTNQGLMPTHIAKQKKLGGELIAEIY